MGLCPATFLNIGYGIWEFNSRPSDLDRQFGVLCWPKVWESTYGDLDCVNKNKTKENRFYPDNGSNGNQKLRLGQVEGETPDHHRFSCRPAPFWNTNGP